MNNVSALKKIVLLSSVCAWALAVPQNAQARRLMPDMPSVEVHFEALEALRYSAQAQGYGGGPRGWDIGPAGKIASAPVGYPDTPPPSTPPAPVTVKAPPPPVEPAPVIAKAPPVKPVPPAPKPMPEVAKAPPPPPPPPVEAKKRPPEQPPVVMAQKPKPLPEPMPAPSDDLAFPPLSPMDEPAPVVTPPEKELASLPPLEPMEPSAAEKTLENELQSLPTLEAAEDVMPSISADLPEPDLKTLEPLPPIAEPEPEPVKPIEKKAEKKVPAPKTIPEKPEDSVAPMKKIVIKAPKEDEMASLDDMDFPPLEGQNDSKSLDDMDFPPMEEMPEPQASAAELPPMEEASPASLDVPPVAPLEEPGLPEAAMPMPPMEEIPAPQKREASPPPEKKEGGMFSGLTGMIGGLLGDDEKKDEPAVAEPALMPAPAAQEDFVVAVPTGLPPSPTDTPPDALPPLPGEEAAPAAAPEGLPSLEAVTSVPGNEEDALDFVKSKTGDAQPLPPLSSDALPPLDAPKEALPPLELADAAPAPAPAESSLPPLPGEEMPPVDVEKELEALPPAMADVDGIKPMSMEKTATADVVVTFAKTETEVPLSAQKPLQELAKKLTSKGNMCGVSVVAYASGSKDQESIARRVSLSRALAIRAFLIDSGVSNMRINVQAMGNKSEGENQERADVFLSGC